MMMEADAHGGGNAATVDATPQWCAFRLERNGGSRRRQRLKSGEREGGRGRDGGAAEAHGGTGREGLCGSSMGLLQIWRMGHASEINVITLRRTWAKMPLWHKTKLFYSLVFQAFFLPSPEDLNQMLKELGDVDMLTLVIQEMSKQFPTLMETIVYERDQ
ncbi:hypothetical protein RHGRI_009996 [Rhododendron griersonianum]|uniref:Uncharacterized protein n=1 Tax=Rhododendron griersonianum TaxID=479676 RepID=A0AAV6KHK6_9ERIC|nr:hypothetical protein RHGRI_009996 [Rhododendron griersonianum]